MLHPKTVIELLCGPLYSMVQLRKEMLCLRAGTEYSKVEIRIRSRIILYLFTVVDGRLREQVAMTSLRRVRGAILPIGFDL